MTASNDMVENIEAELVRRHKAASTTVLGLIVATVLLCVLAYFTKRFVSEQHDPSLDIALRITILILGLGAVALRRTKFSPMRLQDIGGLDGAPGLLRTLEKTTLMVASLGALSVSLGFIATLMSGNDLYTYWAGLIAIAILLYCYPVRRSWKRVVQQFSQSDSPRPPPPPTFTE